MDRETVCRAVSEIAGEESYSRRIYDILSRSAPDESEKLMLREYSEECSISAGELYRTLRRMTGRNSEAEDEEIKESGSYRTVIRGQALREAALSRKCSSLASRIPSDCRIRRLFKCHSDSAHLRATGLCLILFQK